MKDMKLMTAAATKTSKEEIGQAIKTAKREALKDINKEYEAILKDLGECNTTKHDLDKETKQAIQAMKKAIEKEKQQEEYGKIIRTW